MCALVVSLNTSTTADPATPAVPPPAPPIASRIGLTDWVAPTDTPLAPDTLALEPIDASTTPLRIRMAADTPTPEPPLMAMPPAIRFSVGTVSVAAIATAQPDVSVVNCPMEPRVQSQPLGLRTTNRIATAPAPATGGSPVAARAPTGIDELGGRWM